jgi:hypothetical protein
VIRVGSTLHANDTLRDVYAYLNVPDDFIFLPGFSQNNNTGNYSANESKTVNWMLSVPVAQSNYTVNATYTDYYSDAWSSPNAYIYVRYYADSYMIALSGYPEVETSGDYFAEASFTNSGIHENADSAYISIYDSLGSLVAGPSAMNNPSSGVYNYSYVVGASANEGQWETIANATKSGISYVANQFWKVVGGPFDVRDITVVSSDIGSLEISVVTENTGGAAKDLTLEWNLTRADTGEFLDAGAETFIVEANSQKAWTVYPQTGYVGQVRITFLGHYSGTEKAGAYRIFSTTHAGAAAPPSGGAVAGAAPQRLSAENFSAISITSFERTVYATKNIAKGLKVEVKNTGNTTLSSISLTLEGVPASYYNVSPASAAVLLPGGRLEFSVGILITGITGEIDFNYVASSAEASDTKNAKIVITSMADYFIREVERLRGRIGCVRSNLKTDDLKSEMDSCELLVNEIASHAENEEFISARDKAAEAEECIDRVEAASKEEAPPVIIIQQDSTVLILVAAFIVIMAVAIGLVFYMVSRKSDLLSLLRAEEKKVGEKEKEKQGREGAVDADERYFAESIERIEDKLKSIKKMQEEDKEKEPEKAD